MVELSISDLESPSVEEIVANLNRINDRIERLIIVYLAITVLLVGILFVLVRLIFFGSGATPIFVGD